MLHIQQINEDKPQRVLFLNPLGCSSSVWLSSLKTFDDYEVVLIDYPGFGKSEFLPVNSVEDLSVQISESINRLPQKPLHLIGYSFGSWVAQNLVARGQVSQIQSLTLLGSSDHVYNQGIFMIDEWINIIKDMGLESYYKQLAFWSFCTQTFEETPALLNIFIRSGLKSCKDPEVMINQLEVAKKYKHGIDFNDITIPTHIVHGELDCLYPPFCPKKLVNAISHSHLSIVEGVGHSALWEKNQHVSSLICQFIKENS